MCKIEILHFFIFIPNSRTFHEARRSSKFLQCTMYQKHNGKGSHSKSSRLKHNSKHIVRFLLLITTTTIGVSYNLDSIFKILKLWMYKSYKLWTIHILELLHGLIANLQWLMVIYVPLIIGLQSHFVILKGWKHTKPPKNCSHKFNLFAINLFGNIWSHLGFLFVLYIFDYL
jgi:hypothetical protein